MSERETLVGGSYDWKRWRKNVMRLGTSVFFGTCVLYYLMGKQDSFHRLQNVLPEERDLGE
jgi:hypothetical protein